MYRYTFTQRQYNMTGMQEQPLEAPFSHLAIESRIPVFAVTGNRVAAGRRMHTNLMGAPGIDANLHQTGIAIVLHQLEMADSFLAIIADFDDMLTATPHFPQRQVNRSVAVLPVTDEQGQIGLFDSWRMPIVPFFSQRLVQRV